MSRASSRARDGILRGIVWPVFLGVLILLAGTVPRNFLFFANLRYYPGVAWSVPLIVAYVWVLWRYLGGAGPPASTSAARAAYLRANRLAWPAWGWSLVAGLLGIIALVIALQLVNRMVILPEQNVPDLGHVPVFTVAALLLMSAPVAGVVEEAAFRGYMQGPIEGQYGIFLAILITGTMFAVVHLDFTPILWPYYLSVAALYGTIAYMTRSILPAIVLHTGGNLYSNFDLWLHGQAEWQASAGPRALVWESGVDTPFLVSCAVLVVAVTAMGVAFRRLAQTTGGVRVRFSGLEG
jgi:membrane protease YdiL (CAAX protease family)